MVLMRLRWILCTLLCSVIVQSATGSKTNPVVEGHSKRFRRYIHGSARGQTQTQYLNFGDHPDDGKAEAEATDHGSRAFVAGRNGMGQAQSQFSSGDCTDCLGSSVLYDRLAPDPIRTPNTGDITAGLVSTAGATLNHQPMSSAGTYPSNQMGGTSPAKFPNHSAISSQTSPSRHPSPHIQYNPQIQQAKQPTSGDNWHVGQPVEPGQHIQPDKPILTRQPIYTGQPFRPVDQNVPNLPIQQQYPSQSIQPPQSFETNQALVPEYWKQPTPPNEIGQTQNPIQPLQPGQPILKPGQVETPGYTGPELYPRQPQSTDAYQPNRPTQSMQTINNYLGQQQQPESAYPSQTNTTTTGQLQPSQPFNGYVQTPGPCQPQNTGCLTVLIGTGGPHQTVINNSPAADVLSSPTAGTYPSNQMGGTSPAKFPNHSAISSQTSPSRHPSPHIQYNPQIQQAKQPTSGDNWHVGQPVEPGQHIQPDKPILTRQPIYTGQPFRPVDQNVPNLPIQQQYPSQSIQPPKSFETNQALVPEYWKQPTPPNEIGQTQNPIQPLQPGQPILKPGQVETPGYTGPELYPRQPQSTDAYQPNRPTQSMQTINNYLGQQQQPESAYPSQTNTTTTGQLQPSQPFNGYVQTPGPCQPQNTGCLTVLIGTGGPHQTVINNSPAADVLSSPTAGAYPNNVLGYPPSNIPNHNRVSAHTSPNILNNQQSLPTQEPTPADTWHIGQPGQHRPPDKSVLTRQPVYTGQPFRPVDQNILNQPNQQQYPSQSINPGQAVAPQYRKLFIPETGIQPTLSNEIGQPQKSGQPMQPGQRFPSQDIYPSNTYLQPGQFGTPSYTGPETYPRQPQSTDAYQPNQATQTLQAINNYRRQQQQPGSGYPSQTNAIPTRQVQPFQPLNGYVQTPGPCQPQNTGCLTVLIGTGGSNQTLINNSPAADVLSSPTGSTQQLPHTIVHSRPLTTAGGLTVGTQSPSVLAAGHQLHGVQSNVDGSNQNLPGSAVGTEPYTPGLQTSIEGGKQYTVEGSSPGSQAAVLSNQQHPTINNLDNRYPSLQYVPGSGSIPPSATMTYSGELPSFTESSKLYQPNTGGNFGQNPSLGGTQRWLQGEFSSNQQHPTEADSLTFFDPRLPSVRYPSAPSATLPAQAHQAYPYIPGSSAPGQSVSGATFADQAGGVLVAPTVPYSTGGRIGHSYAPGVGNNGNIESVQIRKAYPLSGKSESSGNDDSFSQAESSIKEGQASAIAQGKKNGGTAQTQVSGTYSGSGTFSANAMTSDIERSANAQVIGNEDGVSSSAQGQGGVGKSQSQVQLNKKTGGTLATSQSGGYSHQSQSEVQANEKGGLADAQSSGPGQTSSQAQIGFRPQEKSNNIEHATFNGGGQASAQAGSLSGQSQSQINGHFKYGISYHGAAQSASGTREQVANYREENKVLFQNISQFGSSDGITERVFSEKDQYQQQPSGHSLQSSAVAPTLRSSGKNETSASTLSGMSKIPEEDEYDFEEDNDYDDEYYVEPFKTGQISNENENDSGLSTASVAQPAFSQNAQPEGVVDQPQKTGNRKSSSQKIPEGFRGTVNTEKKYHTRFMPSKHSSTDEPSGQRGTDSYVTVTKSVTGSLDTSKSPTIENQNFASTYYTKSSTCGYFTFSCNIVYGANGRSKICRPKAPSNGKC